ncbi:sushi domain-containing protein 1 isoform X2 [Dendropsophus ebraccatus]|uniref:sushi domain-containing protein 1 isoform X2 n=1 Tax=Dendropsophus ebraccatus TaxID=150705 RepID=UPI0038317204
MTTLSTVHLALETCVLLLLCAHAFTDIISSEVCKTCHPNATCIEKDNKYSCMCNYGLIGNGRTDCIDKNECQIGAHKICGEHTACHNTHGSYYCICLKGYRPSNNHENFIPNDGTFCVDIDECDDSNICGVNGKCKNIPGSYECYCKEGFSLQNGTGPFQAVGGKSLCKDIDECKVPETCGVNSLCKNIPGSFECSCKEGYKLQHSKNTSQNKDFNFTCQAVDCDQPPILPNTKMDLSGATTFASQVIYKCVSGFLEHGHNISVCTANGTWEGATLFCTAIDCGPPVAMLNTVIHTFSSTTFGSNVTFTCAKGFIAVSGYNSSVCSDTGHWEGANLDCRVADCGPPPSINYTKPNLLWNTTYRSTVNYECLPGFVVDSGNKTVTCNENGKWIGDNIICREVNCGMPFMIENAEPMWNNQSSLGSYVYYKCKPGFTDNGRKNFSVCLEDSTWEGLNMTCSVKEDLIAHLIIVNKTCLQWQKSSDISGWKILYEFDIYGIRWDDKDFVDKKSLNYTTENENPVVCLDLLPDTNYTVSMVAITPTFLAIRLNITVNTTMKETVGDIEVLNNTCLKWTRSSSAVRSPEVYTVFIQGRIKSSGVLLQSIMFNFSTDKVSPMLCLDLPFSAEYVVNVTEHSTDQSTYAYINITNDEPENSRKEQILNETCLWWNRSIDGLHEIYKLYVQGKKWSSKELFQGLLYKINTDHNISAICLDVPMDNEYPSNMTGAFSHLVVGEPIQNLSVFNETCLIWRRHLRTKELYVFFIHGYRRNGRSIFYKLVFNIASDEKQPIVCFDLQKGINYTVHVVSAFYPQYPVQISVLAPNSDTPLPKLKIVPAHKQLPKISFQRNDRHGPISSYQVFVIQLVHRCTFTCEFLEAVTYFNNISKTQGYVTAEFFPGDVPDHVEFSVGDRKYYGEFYNAPLERGKDYCVILRTVTKMRTQSCTVIAQVEEPRGSHHYMSVVLLGSVAFACFIVFMSYSLARCRNS